MRVKDTFVNCQHICWCDISCFHDRIHLLVRTFSLRLNWSEWKKSQKKQTYETQGLTSVCMNETPLLRFLPDQTDLNETVWQIQHCHNAEQQQTHTQSHQHLLQTSDSRPRSEPSARSETKILQWQLNSKSHDAMQPQTHSFCSLTNPLLNLPFLWYHFCLPDIWALTSTSWRAVRRYSGKGKSLTSCPTLWPHKLIQDKLSIYSMLQLKLLKPRRIST